MGTYTLPFSRNLTKTVTLAASSSTRGTQGDMDPSFNYMSMKLMVMTEIVMMMVLMMMIMMMIMMMMTTTTMYSYCKRRILQGPPISHQKSTPTLPEVIPEILWLGNRTGLNASPLEGIL